MSKQIWYESNGKTLCFKHAVIAATNENEVRAYVEETVHEDCYDSYAGIIPMCVECYE